MLLSVLPDYDDYQVSSDEYELSEGRCDICSMWKLCCFLCFLPCSNRSKREGGREGGRGGKERERERERERELGRERALHVLLYYFNTHSREN